VHAKLLHARLALFADASLVSWTDACRLCATGTEQHALCNTRCAAAAVFCPVKSMTLFIAPSQRAKADYL
jgi:hypothetical protein